MLLRFAAKITISVGKKSDCGWGWGVGQPRRRQGNIDNVVANTAIESVGHVGMATTTRR